MPKALKLKCVNNKIHHRVVGKARDELHGKTCSRAWHKTGEMVRDVVGIRVWRDVLSEVWDKAREITYRG